MTKLSALEVRRAAYPIGRKGPFMLADGNGLYLQVMPSGSRSWVYRYTLRGRARMMGLGCYGEKAGEVSLSGARRAAGILRESLREGIDPLGAKHAAVVAAAAADVAKKVAGISFEAAAQQYISTHSVGWSNPKHRAQWSSTLASYAYPIFGKRPVSEVNADAIEAALKPIWLRAPETASRLRGRIEAVLDFAKARGWRTGDNPARWRESLKHRLPNVQKVRRQVHYPALPWQQIEAFLGALVAKPSLSSMVLTFAILTASRSGEAREATWAEIDLKKAIWTIPADRMKARHEHRVPLSRAALSILQERSSAGVAKSAFVFASPAGKPLSDMALSMLIRGMNEGEPGAPPAWSDGTGRAVVPHGFRSTFRDWCEEATSTPRAVSEAALAHGAADKVEAAYRRSDLFERRITLMEAWGELCLPALQQATQGPLATT